MPIAITRAVSQSLSHCELSFLDRRPIDVAHARQQHHAYEYALEAAGCRVIALPAVDDWPDAVFVEDVAVVLDEIAICTRPGAASRRGEVASVAKALEPFRRLGSIEGPATLDGGDVLRVSRVIYVGQSGRTNAAGIEQLRSLVSGKSLGGQGYDVQAVPVRGCLHLKSAVTEVAESTILINPAWVDVTPFAHLRQIVSDPSEPHAANALRVGAGVIYPACFPRTLRRLADAHRSHVGGCLGAAKGRRRRDLLQPRVRCIEHACCESTVPTWATLPTNVSPCWCRTAILRVPVPPDRTLP